MRDHDDTVTGPALALFARPDDGAGRASIPCPHDGTLLVGDTCPKCRRTYAPSADRDDEAVLLGAMPGGVPRKPVFGDT